MNVFSLSPKSHPSPLCPHRNQSFILLHLFFKLNQYISLSLGEFPLNIISVGCVSVVLRLSSDSLLFIWCCTLLFLCGCVCKLALQAPHCSLFVNREFAVKVPELKSEFRMYWQIYYMAHRVVLPKLLLYILRPGNTLGFPRSTVANLMTFSLDLATLKTISSSSCFLKKAHGDKSSNILAEHGFHAFKRVANISQ